MITHRPVSENSIIDRFGFIVTARRCSFVSKDKKEMRTEEEFVLSNLGYVREDQPYNE